MEEAATNVAKLNMLFPKNKTVRQLAVAQAIMMSVNTLLLTTSAVIGLELADDKSLATLPMAIQLFAAMLTSIPASFFMQRFSRKAGFYFSSFVGFLGAILAVYSITNQLFIMFCLSALLFGIYTGFGNFYRFVAVEVSLPEEKNTAVSAVLVGGIAAALIGPNLAIFSKDLFEISYTGSFAMVFILYSINLINFKLMHLPIMKLSKEPETPSRPIKQIVKQPVFIVALTTAMFGYALMALLMTATPLSMKAHAYELSDIAFIIQWHVLGMFVPSLFTGHLLNKFGFTAVTMVGAGLLMLCVVMNLTGTLISHYWVALTALGIGWNFLFIGGTTKLTEAYKDDEKAKTQALNDFFIFSAATIASLSAGLLQFHFGWAVVNLSIAPFVLLTAALILWLFWFERRNKRCSA